MGGTTLAGEARPDGTRDPGRGGRTSALRRRGLAGAMFLLAAAIAGSGCDAGLTNRITVRFPDAAVAEAGGSLVVESLWFKDDSAVLGAGSVVEVLRRGGQHPAQDETFGRPDGPGVRVVEGVADLRFEYVVHGPGGRRPPHTTWIAVWRLPRADWDPQEFAVVDGADGLVAPRVHRAGGRGTLGPVAGKPKEVPAERPEIEAWEVVLELEAWKRVKPK